MADHVYRRFTNENLFSTTILAQNRVIVSSGSAGWDGVTFEIVPAVIPQIPSYFTITYGLGALDGTGPFTINVYDTNNVLYANAVTNVILDLVDANTYGVSVSFTSGPSTSLNIGNIVGGTLSHPGLGITLSSTVTELLRAISNATMTVTSADFISVTSASTPVTAWNVPSPTVTTIAGQFFDNDVDLSMSHGRSLAYPYGQNQSVVFYRSDYFEFTADGGHLEIAIRNVSDTLIPSASTNSAGQSNSLLFLYESASLNPIAWNDDAHDQEATWGSAPLGYLNNSWDDWSYLNPGSTGLNILTSGTKYIVEAGQGYSNTVFPFNLQIRSSGVLNLSRIGKPVTWAP